MDTKDVRINHTILVFTSIIKQVLDPSFKVSKGGESARILEKWIGAMDDEYGKLSKERIVDYCVCQAYHVSKMSDNYLSSMWKLGHSFSDRGNAWERYQSTSKQIKYYEDKWLKDNSLDRQSLLDLIQDKDKHPLSHLINPKFEESTKSRHLGTDVGYGICGASTLLYNPFSQSCQACGNSDTCIDRTKGLYPELYRIRMEALQKNDNP